MLSDNCWGRSSFLLSDAYESPMNSIHISPRTFFMSYINELHLPTNETLPNSCGNTPSQWSTRPNLDSPRSINTNQAFLWKSCSKYLAGCDRINFANNAFRNQTNAFDKFTVGHRHISRQAKGPKRYYITNVFPANWYWYGKTYHVPSGKLT